jgi:hypothetical protein
VSHECQEVLPKNQWNLHQKMQVEYPFNDLHPIEAPPQLQDRFASLTTAEMVFLGMDAPGVSSTHARHKRASTTIPDSDEEDEEGDDGDDGDGDADYEDEDDE